MKRIISITTILILLINMTACISAAAAAVITANFRLDLTTEIYTENDLQIMATYVNSSNDIYGGLDYKLMNDIVIEEGGFTPIGTESTPFEGTFDGQGFTIRGIELTTTTQGSGLFGYSSGIIKNLGVENIQIIASTEDGKNVGGIVGNNSGLIENCYSTGSLSGYSTVGGIVGNNKGGTVKNCYSIAAIHCISENTGGGVAGKTELGGTVINSYSLIKPVAKIDEETAPPGSVDDKTSIKTDEEFKNETVVLLLNDELGSRWKQGDNHPVFNYIVQKVLSLKYNDGVITILDAGDIETAVLIITDYNVNGELSDIDIVNVSKADINEEGNIEIPWVESFSKIMLLNDTENLRPLCNAI